jgi:hypothetical protein
MAKCQLTNWFLIERHLVNTVQKETLFDLMTALQIGCIGQMSVDQMVFD